MRDEGGPDRSRLVLVVDDDIGICRLVRAVLEADGFDVEVASDGKSALELAADLMPAVAVLDVRMPGMDGVEVCRLIDRSKTKVVILTGDDDPDVAADLRAAGALAVINKPFSAAQLQEVVEVMAPA